MRHRDRLDAYLAERDLAAVWFARPNTFAWLTGGSNVVSRETDVGVAAAGYDGDGLTVVTDNIEADRLRSEELPADATVEAFDWHDGSLPDAVADVSPGPAAADFDVPGFETVDASPLRQPLDDAEIEAYRSLGRDAAAAVEGVCRDLSPDETERGAAARLRCALEDADAAAPVCLVGGGERAQRHRHFTPKDEPLGDYAIASVVAVRDGLHASLTRTVAFDPPAWFEERQEAALRVDVSALAATRRTAREGGDAGDVFDAIREAYAGVGWGGEWRNHHQGGAAGFAGREWFAGPDGGEAVTAPMAYAYNPTVQGTKSEDTVLVGEDGFEVLTATGDWPSREVSAVGGEASVERHAPLDRS